MPFYVESMRRMIDRYYQEERDHYVSGAFEDLADAVMHLWEVKAKIGKKAFAVYIVDGLGSKHNTLYWENYEYISLSNKKLGKHWLLNDNRPMGGDWKPDPRVLEVMARLDPDDPEPPTWMKHWESCQPKP